MRKLLRFYSVLAVVLLLLGVGMMVFGGFASRVTIQFGGLFMYACSLPLIFEVRISRVETRVRELENALPQQSST